MLEITQNYGTANPEVFSSEKRREIRSPFYKRSDVENEFKHKNSENLFGKNKTCSLANDIY